MVGFSRSVRKTETNKRKNNKMTDIKTTSESVHVNARRFFYPHLGNDLAYQANIVGQVKIAVATPRHRKFVIVKVDSTFEDEANYELQGWVKDPIRCVWTEAWYCGVEKRGDAVAERRRLIALGSNHKHDLD